MVLEEFYILQQDLSRLGEQFGPVLGTGSAKGAVTRRKFLASAVGAKIEEAISNFHAILVAFFSGQDDLEARRGWPPGRLASPRCRFEECSR